MCIRDRIYTPHVPNVPNVPRLDTPYPPVYMRPRAHFILRVLTQIYTPHVPNFPNVPRLDTPYPPVYMRPLAHYTLKVLTQIYIKLIKKEKIIYFGLSFITILSLLIGQTYKNIRTTTLFVG